jgi:triosephosphate isomerase (TIM)
VRRALVAGNWKMNGSLAASRALLSALSSKFEPQRCDVVVCPPYPYLALCGEVLKATRFVLGAQDLHGEPAGAFTGDVSGAMLRDMGCDYVIVGHSERRRHHSESDLLVARKADAALREGLAPIVCVGETQAERDAGQAFAVVERQLAAVAGQLGAVGLIRTVIAYEPVWAIGTGRNATPDEAEEMHRFVRGLLAAHGKQVAEAVRIVYGGSVNGANATSLLGQVNIDGALVGGASLKAEEFMAICRCAEEK